MLTKVIVISFLVLLFLVTLAIVFGLVYHPRGGAVIINPQTTGQGKVCQQSMTACETNADCSVCIDDVEMTCQPLSRYSPDQEQLFGKSGKYCLPEKARAPCNEKNGGVQVWTGWADTERMEFDCLCTYPDYYGGAECENLNAGVCNGNDGSFQFDARVSTAPPGPANCNCPSDTHMVVRKIGQTPICIPEKVYPAYYSGTEQGGPVAGCGSG
jgi:hypothetical protein